MPQLLYAPDHTSQLKANTPMGANMDKNIFATCTTGALGIKMTTKLQLQAKKEWHSSVAPCTALHQAQDRA